MKSISKFKIKSDQTQWVMNRRRMELVSLGIDSDLHKTYIILVVLIRKILIIMFSSFQTSANTQLKQLISKLKSLVAELITKTGSLSLTEETSLVKQLDELHISANTEVREAKIITHLGTSARFMCRHVLKIRFTAGSGLFSCPI